MTEPNLADRLREYEGKLDFPGAMLMKYGPEDYVGATLVVRGTLYFHHAHTAGVREAICECFDQYEAIAKDHLEWLWREEPPSGPTRFAYAKAPKLRDMMKRLQEDHYTGFAYTSGTQAHDASAWQFYVSGMAGWEAKMGTRGTSSIQWTMPPLFVEENSRAFQQTFVDFARRLRAIHGHGGHALQLSLVRKEPNEPVEAMMADAAHGVDIGSAVQVSGRTQYGITDHIKTIGWLTAINRDMVDKIGDMLTFRSELPLDWYAFYDYGAGIVIQAGPKPQIAAVEVDPKPAIYALVNHLLREVRIEKIGDLHYGSKDGEPRITGWSAEQWLKRFDIEEDELLKYKAKLLQEPKLTPATTLPDRLNKPRDL
jgi:Protein of unknown function (DUF3396)